MCKVIWFRNFLIIQSCIALAFTLGSGIGKGVEAALSALMGGGIAILPGLIFSRLFFKANPVQATSIGESLHSPKTTPCSYKAIPPKSAKQMLTYFYLAEVLKLLIIAILFTLAFQWGRLRPVPLLLTFAITYAGYGLLPWTTRKL